MITDVRETRLEGRRLRPPVGIPFDKGIDGRIAVQGIHPHQRNDFRIDSHHSHIVLEDLEHAGTLGRRFEHLDVGVGKDGVAAQAQVHLDGRAAGGTPRNFL